MTVISPDNAAILHQFNSACWVILHAFLTTVFFGGFVGGGGGGGGGLNQLFQKNLLRMPSEC